ncbi:hypothetical protein ACFE04_014448 [Oxalis oulophora]
MGCDKLCRRFAKELNCVIMSVNYRLAPEYKYPSQHEDGFDALKYIDNNEFARANLKQVFLAGDSAGANLAHFVAIKASEYRENFQRVKVIGLLASQPFFGGEERTDSELKLVNDPMITLQGTDLLWKYFLPDGANRDHPAVNVFGPNGYDISKVEDPLRDWQMRYYDGLKKGGKETYLVEYPNAFHAFYGFDELKESGLLIQEAKVFIEKQLGLKRHQTRLRSIDEKRHKAKTLMSKLRPRRITNVELNRYFAAISSLKNIITNWSI